MRPYGHRPSLAAANDDAIRALADEMDVDADELLLRAFPLVGDQSSTRGNRRFGGLTVPRAFVETRRRRFAPAAFRLPGGDYHRGIWDLRLLPVCTETGQILLDRCDGRLCDGAHSGWVKTLGIDRCEHCMADLSRMKSPVIQPDLLARLQPVADLFTPARRTAALALLPTGLADDGGQLAADLLIRLLPIVDPELWPHVNWPYRADPSQLCRGLASAWELVAGWPHAFHHLALERVLGRARHHQDGNGDHTIRFLKMKVATFSSPALVSTAHAARDMIDVQGPNAVRIAASTCTIKETATMLSAGTAVIAQTRRAGALRSILVYDGGRLQPLFDRSEIAGIAADIPHRVGFGTICAELGIPHYGVEQLADMQHLDVLPHPFFLARYAMHQATKASYLGLINHLAKRQTALPTRGTVPLRQALKAVGGGYKPWGPLIAALLDRTLRYSIRPGRQPIAHRILIRTQDVSLVADITFVPAVPGGLPYSTMMSKADAGELLNIGAKQVCMLFSHIPSSTRKREKSLSASEVLEIAGRCISSAELAARRGLPPQKAFAAAKRAGITFHGAAGFSREEAEAAFRLNSMRGLLPP